MLKLIKVRLVIKNVLLQLSILGIVCSCNPKDSSDNNKRKDKIQEVKARQMKTPEIVKVGVLFSLTGHMAISEVSSRDAVLMAIEEINDDGGLLGKKIEPVVLDPHSNLSYYPVLAVQLFNKHKVQTIFGGSSVEARKALIPFLDKNNGLLFYPFPVEESEQAENIVYLGATPNQQILPALSYLLNATGGAYNKFYLLSNPGIYSVKANQIMRNYLIQNGIPATNIIVKQTKVNQESFEQVVSDIKRFSTSGKACVLSTISGSSNIAFYKEFANQGLSAASCPIMAFSIAEDELRQTITEFFAGHLCAKNYFQSVNTDKNIRFVSSFKLYCAIHELPDGVDRVTSDAICWAYTGVQLWRKAVEKAGSFENSKVKEALRGLTYNSPAGMVQIDKYNLHLSKPVYIGESKADGQFEVVWQSDTLVVPEVMPEAKLKNKRQVLTKSKLTFKSKVDKVKI